MKKIYRYGVKYFWADGSVWGTLFYSSYKLALFHLKRYNKNHSYEKPAKYIGRVTKWNKEREAV
jgi:hypothetical protein